MNPPPDKNISMNALKNKQRDIFYEQTSFYFAPVLLHPVRSDTKSEVGVI